MKVVYGLIWSHSNRRELDQRMPIIRNLNWARKALISALPLFHVCAWSILNRDHQPVTIVALIMNVTHSFTMIDCCKVRNVNRILTSEYLRYWKAQQGCWIAFLIQTQRLEYAIAQSLHYISIFFYWLILLFIFQSKRAHKLGAIGAIYYMDPQEYARKGVDKVFPNYNWMPSTAVQRGNIKSTPIRGDPQTPGYPSVGKIVLLYNLECFIGIFSTEKNLITTSEKLR